MENAGWLRGKDVIACTGLRMLLTLLPVATALPCFAQGPNPASLSIAVVEVYGSAHVDFAAIRAGLPFHIGDHIPEQEPSLANVPAEVRKAVGGNAFTVAPVFVPDVNGWILYIDVEPQSSAGGLTAKPQLTADAQLPPSVVAFYEQAMLRLINGGVQAGDDTSEGYSLSRDPTMREDELKLLQYAREQPQKVFEVLTTSKSDQDRMAAAWCAGYAPKGTAQVQALLAAISDPNGVVRNNAIRVLGVLAIHDPKVAVSIPADPFIPLLSSTTWTDRNKALMLLMFLTVSRQPSTIAALRSRALEPLMQMAHWTYLGHSSAALLILGRVSGIPEQELQQLVAARKPADIIHEVERRLGLTSKSEPSHS